MTKTELLELIKNGENSGVEFKRDTIDNRALGKELVAFANLRGGRLILGVEDDGSITGITRDQLEEWVMTACRDKIRPELIPYYEIIRDVEAGKDVAIVQVDRGWAVHHVWHNNHRTYYIRVGTLSREASAEELERLFQQRGAFRLEIRGVTGSSVSDFDFRRLRDYFHRVRSQQAPGIDDPEAWQRLLLNTEFLIDEGDRKPATVAGLLLFCANPNRFLPQAGIDAVAYPGKEKDYAARERLSIRGPMTALIGDGGIVDNGIVEQAVEFVRRNTGVVATLVDGARREQKWTYPEEAVREIIVNALVHRDYLLSGTTVELSIYDDRMEVTSPGRLPNYLEHMGMGIPRKVVKSMLAHNGTMPELIEEDERFTVRLAAHRQTGS